MAKVSNAQYINYVAPKGCLDSFMVQVLERANPNLARQYDGGFGKLPSYLQQNYFYSLIPFIETKKHGWNRGLDLATLSG